MRVTCPACGARYSVGDEAIPQGGRMVQCSACGHLWRMTPAAAAVAAPGVAAPTVIASADPAPYAPQRAPTVAEPAGTPQPATMAASLEAEHAPPRRGGFLAGFVVVALLAMTAATLYAKHAAIAAAAPALAEPLSAYVAAVDQGRALLADTVAGLREGG